MSETRGLNPLPEWVAAFDTGGVREYLDDTSAHRFSGLNYRLGMKEKGRLLGEVIIPRLFVVRNFREVACTGGVVEEV